MKRVLFWARIPIVVIATAFPVVFAKRIESLEIKYIVGFILLVAIGAVVEVLFDREAASELERRTAELEATRRRLQIQKARGLTMARLLGLISPLMAILARKSLLTPAEREAAARKLDAPIVEVLKAVCEDVWTYWYGYGSTEPPFKGSVMVAYRIGDCDKTILLELSKRIKFLGFGRDLDSYAHALDVVQWSDTNPQFVPIAIPVEDENSPEGIKRLLPGAPTAFARGEDVVVSDTHNLREHAGSDVEVDLLRKEQEYFDSKRIRSMACLLLHEASDKKQNQNRIGVLNIHSEKVDILGTTKQEQLTILQSLEHYRVALEYLLDGQRQLAT
jgi:hypothetical protein